MRLAPLVVALLLPACPPPPSAQPYYGPATYEPPQVNAPETQDLSQAGVSVQRSYDFAFDGGRIEFEMRRAADQVAATSPDFLEFKRVNWVLVLHDDGTLGEYMHLAPAGVEVQPGTPVNRGDELALSGNTGFSSTPHLHFQVMTAGEDGVSARSFPFRLAVSAAHDEEPVQGRAYRSWE